MKQVLMSFAFCLLAQSIFAQELPKGIDILQNVVIAKSGLRMRSAPNLKSKKLQTVPFGETVKITHNESFGVLLKNGETITTQAFNKAIDKYFDAILGDWVKVDYQGIIGYMCNAYLFNAKHKTSIEQEKKRGLNQDIVLLKGGTNCFNNVFPQAGRYWYGLSNEKIEVVEVEYKAVFADGPAYYMLETSTKRGYDYFIIGSKTPFKTGESVNDLEDIFGVGSTKLRHQEVMAKHHLKVVKLKNEYNGTELWVERDGKKQLLNPKNDRFYTESVVLEWAGDIDGDGQSDYIITFGEETSECILYLSSKAEGDQLVKPVAVWFSGYCC